MYNWEIQTKPLGEILNLRRGYDLPKTEMCTGKIPVIGSNGIIGYHNKITTKAPCLTVGRSGSVGKLFYSDIDSWAHNTTLFVDDFKGNDPKYIFYLLQTLDLGSYHGGSVIPSLNRNYLHPLLIRYSSDLENQRKIASVLSILDAKIELNNRINAELEAMAKTQYDYWFVQFDFPDKNGKPYKSSGGKMVWKEELKREIPAEWSSKTLEDLGEFKNGVNYDPSIIGNTEAKIINVRNISSSTWFVSQYELDTIILEKKDVNNYLVTEKDILIARSGIPGATRIMFEYIKNTIYCGFIIRYQIKILNNKNYLFFCLKDLESSTTSKSAGTIMQNVNQETLKRMLVIMPRDEMIYKFNNFILPIFERINNNFKENQTLSELRDWLLPMLMNGQVKVI